MGIGHWPQGVPREVTIDAFMRAYSTLGYILCFNESLEEGLEKIALYGTANPDGSVIPTHAALQLESGKWTSKLGPFEDVRHDAVDDVRGPVYGRMICCMSRPRRP